MEPLIPNLSLSSQDALGASVFLLRQVIESGAVFRNKDSLCHSFNIICSHSPVSLWFSVNFFCITQKLKLTNIVSIYQLGNEASLRIMQRLGMQFDRETIDPNNGRRIAVYRLPTA